MKLYLVLIFVMASLLLNGCAVPSVSLPVPTYKQILITGVKPVLPVDFKFPNSYQYQNGCFAFAVNHVLEYKFDKTVDLYKAEKKIKKPRNVLWNVDYITDFLNEYDIKMYWYKDAGSFFDFLSKGEPLVIQYPYDIGHGKAIGHLVATYSFDQTGVWAADSISGRNIHIDYDLVFNKTDKYTRYGFATVWMDD